jgi:chromosome partitioning protein
MIDYDSQASLTVAVGLELTETEDVNLGNVLLGDVMLEDALLSVDCTSAVVDIIPSHNSFASVVQANYDVNTLSQIMQKLLDTVKDLYDYVLLDCPPTICTLLVSALMLSDGVIMPVLGADYHSLVSVQNTLTDMIDVQEVRAGKPEFLGLLVTRYKKNIRNHVALYEHLREQYRILGTLSDTDAFTTALSMGLPVGEVKPTTMQSRAAAREYAKIAEFVINHCEYSDGKNQHNKKTVKAQKKTNISKKAK